MFNTERESVQFCVGELIDAVRSPQFAETPSARIELQRLALRARLKAALHCQEETRNLNVDIRIDQGPHHAVGHGGERRRAAHRGGAGVVPYPR
ncbi:hypothetical protein [Pelomicrobium sp.]|uniref:hypothetical protein n=1 Tax=Pelomicrobium sp. TaxID=2815319 RepID=UPI002FDE0370